MPVYGSPTHRAAVRYPAEKNKPSQSEGFSTELRALQLLFSARDGIGRVSLLDQSSAAVAIAALHTSRFDILVKLTSFATFSASF